MDDDTSTELDRIRITSQAELHRLWELLMHPLGFRDLTLWVTFVGEDRRPERFLLEIAESVGVPEPDEVAALFALVARLRAERFPGSTVALLVARPGRAQLTQVDRVLSARLLAAAADAQVPLEPIHVANDVRVLVVAPDDLAA